MASISNSFEAYLSQAQCIILDGGLATELEAQGHDLSSALWSALLLRDKPQAIIDAHRAFFESGADCTISASYQGTRAGLMGLGLSANEARELIIKSVQLAATAREDFMASRDHEGMVPLVAASVGPYGASLADGSEYTGDYGISDQALGDFHRERLHWLDGSGADVLACETIPSLQEAKVLHDLLSEVNSPAWVSFSCKDGKHLNDGTPIQACARLFSGHPKVKAIGVNCTSPKYINSLIQEIKTATPEQNVIVYPNSGETYSADDKSWHGTSSPLECGVAARTWRDNGAIIIGGCCRMGPDHIREIQQHLE